MMKEEMPLRSRPLGAAWRLLVVMVVLTVVVMVVVVSLLLLLLLAVLQVVLPGAGVWFSSPPALLSYTMGSGPYLLFFLLFFSFS